MKVNWTETEQQVDLQLTQREASVACRLAGYTAVPEPSLRKLFAKLYMELPGRVVRMSSTGTPKLDTTSGIPASPVELVLEGEARELATFRCLANSFAESTDDGLMLGRLSRGSHTHGIGYTGLLVGRVERGVRNLLLMERSSP